MNNPPTREDIFQIIRHQLAEILEINEDRISEGSSFVDDLDADSLALIELVEAIEGEFSKGEHQFRIEDDDLEDLRTMRDAVDYVVQVLGVSQ
ncbi:MAG: acyl carrier protein [Ferrimicrobium sp.]|uniref:acyl carrier protein n=1 Tax=Ferrimicrobium sp. TaxID=2926050 RepID=UPI00262B20D8|nr:acyl carrier protein [Ferrimicrobium sp.]